MTSTKAHNETKTTYGLGIDAGGTYTDVAVYNYADHSIVATSKALTTRWNYTEGIKNALDAIPPEHLRDIDLVSVSTTLATNAIVENHGQKVGLLLMPPYGRFEERELPHSPTAVIKGQTEMPGTIVEPIDPGEVEAVAKAMVREHGVTAFAVSGCCSIMNATQELEVMEIVHKATSLSVTCGHQLSGKLGMYERAVTSIFNARVIPYIETFLRKLQAALTDRNIDAPIMVVKGDGTLMSVEMAKERPVETIFSGPAASVTGARKLTNLENALVVDIGGTTTDIAAIKDNRVETCARGNVVAGMRTHVEALDMRTKGLGGDSAINVQMRKLSIGPARVTPVACLASTWSQLSAALDFVEKDSDPYRIATAPMHFLAMTNHNEPFSPTPREADILNRLKVRPYSIEELCQELDIYYRSLGEFTRLLNHHLVAVSTLTPTDVLHAEGRVHLWDNDTAKRVCTIFARLMNLSYDDFAEQVLDTFTRGLATELFIKLMGETIEDDALDASPASQAILDRWLAPKDNEFAINMQLPYPIIGVGAPARELLPPAAKLFNTTCTIPDDYDVANAVGAITSTVSISKSVKVAPQREDCFVIEGLAEGREFDNLDEAIECARIQLTDEIRKQADKAGLLNPPIQVVIKDDTILNGYGAEIFLGTIISAEITARPEGKNLFERG